MSRADYDHLNEDADYHWWHEEGKHPSEPPELDDFERDYEEEEARADRDPDDEA